MNLKEVLNYRNRCLICYSKMKVSAYDLAGITIHRTSEGLMIETGLKGVAVYFKYDGTYEKMKRWNNLYSKPMSLLKECPKCIPNLSGLQRSDIVFKSRSVGATTSVSNVKDLRCAYTFQMWGDAEGNFDSKLDWEDIKYHDDDRFYHINTKFQDNRTEIKSADFQDTIDSVFKLNVPAMKCNSIKTTSQLIHKIKTYMIFS
jgi:hypothetical protein